MLFSPCRANAGSGSCIRAATLAMVREIRSLPSVGSSSCPSCCQVTSGAASVSSVTTFRMSRARPNESNPGPRLAEVAGTVTERRMTRGA
jgi:hypothetical protein